VSEEGRTASWANIAAHPLSGERLTLEKTRERGAAFSGIEVNRPARYVADHFLWREFVALKLGGHRMVQPGALLGLFYLNHLNN
jgi:hypothetical protein